MLLSDRDIRGEIKEGRVELEPYDEEMIQPSSIDVRLDRFVRVFENHRYPHIDPAADQLDLTRAVEPVGNEPFILHPGSSYSARRTRWSRCPTTWRQGSRGSPPSAGWGS